MRIKVEVNLVLGRIIWRGASATRFSWANKLFHPLVFSGVHRLDYFARNKLPEASQLRSDISRVMRKSDADPRPRTTSLKPRLSRMGLRCVYFLARSLNRRLKPSLCARALQKSRDYV